MFFFSSSAGPTAAEIAAAIAEEDEKVKSLQERVNEANFPYKFSVAAHKRFLVGLKQNVSAAFEAMANHVAWRQRVRLELKLILFQIYDYA